MRKVSGRRKDQYKGQKAETSVVCMGGSRSGAQWVSGKAMGDEVKELCMNDSSCEAREEKGLGVIPVQKQTLGGFYQQDLMLYAFQV